MLVVPILLIASIIRLSRWWDGRLSGRLGSRLGSRLGAISCPQTIGQRIPSSNQARETVEQVEEAQYFVHAFSALSFGQSNRRIVHVLAVATVKGGGNCEVQAQVEAARIGHGGI